MLETFKWSIEDWHQLVESGVLEGKKVELLEGEITQMSPESVEHSYTNYSVGEYFRELLKNQAIVREAHPITLDNSEPEPDIVVVRLPANIYRQHHPYAQDIYWLVEISKRTLKKDLEEKAAIYARNAIAEYWVIDLVNKKLIVHTYPQGDRYTQIVEYSTQALTPQAFPNIAVSLDRLLLY